MSSVSAKAQYVKFRLADKKVWNLYDMQNNTGINIITHTKTIDKCVFVQYNIVIKLRRHHSMASTTLQSLRVSCKLDNGTDAQGNQKTVSINFPTLSKNNFDADDALSVVTALEPCLSKSVLSVQETRVSSISAA